MGVGGSSPLISTRDIDENTTPPFVLSGVSERVHSSLPETFVSNNLGGLAQLARAPALQAGGHRFEPDILHHIKQMCIKHIFLI